jgi:hypothetical protein
MRRVCSLIAGVVTALTLAGCSESPPETGTVQFKGTQSPAIDAMRDSMAKNAAGGGKSTAKSSNGTAKSATDAKAGDAKATTATKEDEKP